MSELLPFRIYQEGTSAFLDAFLCGLIPCVVTRILIPGTGQSGSGTKIEAQVSRTGRGFSKGELIIQHSTMIFPRERLLHRGFHLRINTLYAWGPPDMPVRHRRVDPSDPASLLIWEVDPDWLKAYEHKNTETVAGSQSRRCAGHASLRAGTLV